MARSLLSELIVRISAQADGSLNTNLRSVRKQIEDTTGEIQNLAQQGVLAFGGIAVGAGALIKNWLDAAGAMEQYRAKLETVLKSSTAAQETLQKSVEFAAKTPFDVNSIVDATVKLEVYGQRSQEILPRVGDLAAGMGKNISDTSLVIGKAMSGSLEGFESLRNEYGISTAKLVQYGAVMNEMGGISVKTTADLDKARTALLAVIKTEFGGAMERQSKTWLGAVSNLQDSVAKLATSFGEQLVPAATSATRTITGVVEWFNNLPVAIKSFAAFGTVAVAGMASLAAAGTGLVAVFPSLYNGWQLINKIIVPNTAALQMNSLAFGLNTKEMLFNRLVLQGYPPVVAKTATAFSGLTGTIMSYAGIAMILYQAGNIIIENMKKQSDQLEASVKRDEAALKAARQAFRTFKDATAQDVAAMGITVKDMQDNMKAMVDAAKKNYDEYIKLTDRQNYYQWMDPQREKTQADKDAAAQSIKVYADAIRMTQSAIEKQQDYKKQTKSAKYALEDFATSYKILKDSDSFRTLGQEAEELQYRLKTAGSILKSVGVDARNRINFNFDYTSVEETRKKIVEVQTVIDDLKRKKGESKDDIQKAIFDVDIAMLENYLALVKGNYQNQEKIDEQRLQSKKDWIEYKKSLNQESLAQEITDNKKILQEMQRQNKSEEDILKQKRHIEKLQYDLKKQNQDDAARGVEKEIDAVENMATGQIAAYDQIILKIRQMRTERKISESDAYKMEQQAVKGKKQTTDKKEKERYDNLKDVQAKYLDEVEKSEETSSTRKIEIYRSYIRFWEDAERRRVITHAQAQDQILLLTKKTTDEEKRIYEANKDFQRDLNEQKKSFIDYDIGKLTDQLNAGEDVQNKILEKMRLRHDLEMAMIDEQKKEWEKQGILKEKLEQGVANLREKSAREELAALDSVIEKVKQANEEKEKGSKPGSMMDLGGFLDYQASLFADKPKGGPDIGSLQSQRDRLARDVESKQRQREMNKSANVFQGIEAPKMPDPTAGLKQMQSIVNNNANINVTLNINGTTTSGQGVTATDLGKKVRLEIPKSLDDLKNRANRPIGY